MPSEGYHLINDQIKLNIDYLFERVKEKKTV